MPRLTPLIAAELFCQPLLVNDQYLEVMLTAIHERLDIQPIVSQSVLEENHRPRRSSHFDPKTGIAIVPIVGGLTHRSGYSAESGSTGYIGIQSELQYLASEGARGFVLDFDSPGGSVAGVMQTGDFIRKLSAEFPVYAVANELMASAAYWLAAPSTRIYASPLANVGSIGVTTAHIDRSEQMKRMGVVVTHISAGARKTDGSPYGPLSDDALKAIKDRIDHTYTAFVDHVAKSRGIDQKAVRGTEAGVFGSEQAKELGLIDGIASLSEAIDAMKTKLRGPQFSLGSFSQPNTGARAAMAENLIYSQADLDAAVAKAVAERKTAADKALADAAANANAEGAITALTTLTAAMSTLFAGDTRAETFVELIKDGMAPDKAAKHASKITASAAKPDDPASRFKAAAPHVPDDTNATTENRPAAAVPGQPTAEERAAFRASLGLGNGQKLQSPIATGAITVKM